jgi:hypothetical protein
MDLKMVIIKMKECNVYIKFVKHNLEVILDVFQIYKFII